jgi:hypothetical protein
MLLILSPGIGSSGEPSLSVRWPGFWGIASGRNGSISVCRGGVFCFASGVEEWTYRAIPISPPKSIWRVSACQRRRTNISMGKSGPLHREDRRQDTPEELRTHHLLLQKIEEEFRRHLSASDYEIVAGEGGGEGLFSGWADHPDLVVLSDSLPSGEEPTMTTRNPVLIAEFISPSTAGRDRGAKYSRYQDLALLQDYLLVKIHEPRLELYSRLNEKEWLYQTVEGFEGEIELTSVGFHLNLDSLYGGLTLPPADW